MHDSNLEKIHLIKSKLTFSDEYKTDLGRCL